MASTKFRVVYERFEHPGLTCNDPSRTKQSFKEECDINNILKRFNKTGILPDMIKANPSYGDFSDAMEYQDACNLVIRAREQFDALGSHVRDRFGNDPAQFLEFVHNPANAEEMAKMGLMAPDAVERVTEQRRAKATGSKKGSPDSSGEPAKP